MRKAVVLKGQNAAVDEVLEQLEDLHTRATQELNFLDLQHRNARDRFMREGVDLDTKLEQLCVKENLMPKEYQIKNSEHCADYDHKTRVVYAIMGREEQRNPVEIIMGMFTDRE